MGGVPVPIPYTEIEAYCRLKNIFLPSERERLLRLLERVDREYMRQQAEKMEKDGKKASSPPPPSHSPPRRTGRRPPRNQVR